MGGTEKGWKATVQLTYSRQQNKDRIQTITQILCACLLGGSTLAAGCSAFGLSWSPASAFQGNPLHGFLSVCNSIADRLGTTDYIILRKFAGGAGADGAGMPQGAFLSLALVLLCVLAYLILRSGCKWLLLLYLIPAGLVCFATGAAPGPWQGLMFGFALVCAYAVMQEGGGSLLMLVVPALALVVSLAAGLAIDQGPGFAPTSLQKQTGTAMEGMLDKRFGENPLGNGDLVRLTGEEVVALRGTADQAIQVLTEGGTDKTKTALTVTAGEAGNAADTGDSDIGALQTAGQTPAGLQACWLRGFVGEAYMNHRWTVLGNETYYSQRDALYWMNRQGFDGLSQLSEAAMQTPQAAETGEPFRLTVEADQADRSLIYTPYEITGTDQALPEGTRNYAGGFLKTDRVFGSKNYSYTMLPGLTGSWTDWVGRLYSTDSSPALQAYLTSESHYNVWCYEQYTKVPEELMTGFYIAVGDPGDLTGDHADYKQAISKVRTYLDENFIYTDNFGLPEAGEDPIEQFLISGKGCDVQYASLATMLMRYFGIPARYVEGYLITPQDASNAKAGQPLQLGYSHAHAWTEIYIDGFGWVPMEFTSAWRGIMPEADLERGLESIAYENKKNEMTDNLLEEAADAEPPDYGALVRRVLLAAGLILLALLLIWILQKLVRRGITEMRLRRTFADPDPRKGICAMYGHMMAEGWPLSQKAQDIGDRAAYSQLPVYENERNAMRQELEWGKHEQKTLDKNNRGGLSDRIASGFAGLRRK